MSPEHITPERLREVLDYNAETGEFRWKVIPSNRVKVGDVAGTLHSAGYWQIRVDRRRYLAHRLAWLYTYSQWPEHEIDHINGVRLDNRLSNLRVATCLEQRQNAARLSTNTSGYTGVHWCKDARKWQARIYVDGKIKSLGYFDDWLYACRARLRANKKYGYHPNHGLRSEHRAEN